MVSPALRTARKVVPVTALVVALITLFGCVILAKARGVYLSGMFWPFFSNTGRDKPMYYIFCAGLTLTAVLVAATYTFNHQYQRALLRKAARAGESTRKHERMAMATWIAGTISVFGLSLLAFFDTAKYPKTHQLTAYWFFAWEVVATVTNTFVSKRLYHLSTLSDAVFASNYVILEDTGKTNMDERADRSRRRLRTVRIQLTLNLIFLVAFIIYIPWQLAFPYHCPMLTIDDCLSRNLGDHYCTVTMRKNSLETILQNCEHNLTKVQIRALAQLVCILTLVGYCVTFYAHDYDDADREDNRDLAPVLHPL